jgi:hypothetical protein
MLAPAWLVSPRTLDRPSTESMVIDGPSSLPETQGPLGVRTKGLQAVVTSIGSGVCEKKQVAEVRRTV